MAENVDYTKSSAQQSPEKGLSARKVLDALQVAHFSNADRKDVEAHLTDDKLGYSPEAVEAASALLQHIHDSGVSLRCSCPQRWGRNLTEDEKRCQFRPSER